MITLLEAEDRIQRLSDALRDRYTIDSLIKIEVTVNAEVHDKTSYRYYNPLHRVVFDSIHSASEPDGYYSGSFKLDPEDR